MYLYRNTIHKIKKLQQKPNNFDKVFQIKKNYCSEVTITINCFYFVLFFFIWHCKSKKTINFKFKKIPPPSCNACNLFPPVTWQLSYTEGWSSKLRCGLYFSKLVTGILNSLTSLSISLSLFFGIITLSNSVGRGIN